MRVRLLETNGEGYLSMDGRRKKHQNGSLCQVRSPSVFRYSSSRILQTVSISFLSQSKYLDSLSRPAMVKILVGADSWQLLQEIR